MRGFSAALFAAFCLLGHPAHAHDTEAYGGRGGGTFSDQCGIAPAPANLLIGFSGRAGAWIARTTAVCATWFASESFGPETNLRTRGESTGGEDEQAFCPSGQAVSAIRVWPTYDEAENLQYVAAFELLCEPVRLPAGERTRRVVFGNIPNSAVGTEPTIFSPRFRMTREVETLSCPPGQLATGVHGRAGYYVDAIGLICDAAPVLARMPEPVRTQSGREIVGQARPLPGSVGRAIEQRAPSDECLPGFQWRLAGPRDRVCAPPEARRRTAMENEFNTQRTIWSDGPYGRHTCIDGYTWRLAFDNDVVCVTPEAREEALAENRYHFRRAH